MRFPLHIILSALLLGTLNINLPGQAGNTLYLMHELPQSGLLNPATGLQCRYYIGIPGLASSSLAYHNTAFSANDLLGGAQWDLEGLLSQMHRTDLYEASAQLNLLSLGYRLKGWTLRFDLLENLRIGTTIPGDLPEMLIHGNGAFIGETADFSAFRIMAIHQRAWTLAASRAIGPRMRAGLRARLLFGKAALHSGVSGAGFSTSEDHFYIDIDADYLLHAALPVTLTDLTGGSFPEITMNEIAPLPYLLNRGNPGFSIDLGMIYRYDESTTLSASVNDLGFIRWTTDLNTIEIRESVSFRGMDATSEIISFDHLTSLVDSVLEIQDPLVSHDPFSLILPPRVYLGVSRQLNEIFSIGAVSSHTVYHYKIKSSLSLSARATIFEHLSGCLSWSLMNNSIKHIGAGVAWHGRGFQFHLASDNLLGFFYPFDTRTLQLQAGFNILIGCPRNKQEALREENAGRAITGGDCSWTGRGRTGKQGKRKTSR